MTLRPLISCLALVWAAAFCSAQVRVTIPATLPAGEYVLSPATAPAEPATQPSDDFRPFLGAHLESNSDYNRARYFIDVAKSFRPWGTVASPFGSGAPVDASGWPTTDAATIFFTDRGPEIAGNYILSWDGGGTARVTGGGTVESQTPGRAVVRIWRGNVTLAITGTVNGPKNVKLLPPGYTSDAAVFTPEFLSLLSRFDAFRAMDLTATNDSTVAKWSDRAQWTDATYAWRGWPWERVVDLANAVDRDVWVNVPLLADDDYVRQLAALVRGRLKSGLHCYVEYSNEVWNGQFKAYAQNLDLTRAAIAGGDVTLLAYDGTKPNEIYSSRLRYAKRCAEIAALLNGPPFRMVLATQVNGHWGDPGDPAAQLDYVARNIGDPSKIFFALAGAPYLSCGRDSSGRQWTASSPITADQILARLADRAALHAATDGQLKLAALAKRWNLHCIGYELGVDLQQSRNDVAAKAASQTDPRMRGIVADYLKAFYATGADGGFIFALSGEYTSNGYWGFCNDAVDVGHPKLLGALDARAAIRPAN